VPRKDRGLLSKGIHMRTLCSAPIATHHRTQIIDTKQENISLLYIACNALPKKQKADCHETPKVL
jgi:hypothetical protein